MSIVAQHRIREWYIKGHECPMSVCIGIRSLSANQHRQHAILRHLALCARSSAAGFGRAGQGPHQVSQGSRQCQRRYFPAKRKERVLCWNERESRPFLPS